MGSYNTSEFKSGLKILIDNDPYVIVENEMVKPGKGQAFNRVRVRNLKTGRTVEKTWKSGDSVESADVVDTDMQYLYSDEGQAIAVKHNLRPRSPALLKQHQAKFIGVPPFTVDEVFGGWSRVQAEHFRDGGIYDQITAAGRAK